MIKNKVNQPQKPNSQRFTDNYLLLTEKFFSPILGIFCLKSFGKLCWVEGNDSFYKDIKQEIMKNLFKNYLSISLFALIMIVVACKSTEVMNPAKSSDKTMSSFAFGLLTPAVSATITGTTVAAMVPFNVDVTSLAPTVTVASKATVSPASGSTQNFTNAVTYTVTAEDGMTQAYSVTVTKGIAPKSKAKDITKFSFAALSPVVDATIDATAKTISATVPAGTDATKLLPTITISDKATISPASGVATDFSKDVIYSVTAEDGTKQDYKVTITVPKPVTLTIDCNSKIPEVWEDLGDGIDYIVKCNISIGGSAVTSITIKPGVRIQFDGGDAGFSVSNNFLKMIGTKAKPIILEGKSAVAGSWKGIYIEAVNVENQWDYVTLRYAGATQGAGLLINGYKEHRIGITNCTFTDNTGYGVRVGADKIGTDWYTNCKFSSFANNTFTKNTKSAVRIHYSQWGNLDSKSDYSNNGQDFIEVFASNITNYDAALDGAITIQKLNVPYRVSGLLHPNEPFIFSKGVEVQFTTDASIFLTENNKNAAIIADGTASEPIRFVGYIANTKGVWAGISAQNGNPTTKLNYCIIDGAGSSADPFFCVPKTSKSAVYLGLEYSCSPIDSKGTVTNCIISNSGGYGISYRNCDPITIKDNTFKDNTKTDTYNFK